MSKRTALTNQSTIVTDTGPIRVLHVTDPHLFADKSGKLRGTVSYSSLERVLGHYRRGDWSADLVMATGDLIQDDSAEAYVHFRDLLSGLELPVACIPGNHDVRPLMREALSDEPFSYCPDLRIGNWLLASVDSCVDGKAGGRIGKQDLDRLNDIITGSDADYIAVFLHHPPVPMDSRWLDSVGLENAAALMGLLQSDERVRVTVFGHVHQAYDAQHDGVRFIGTPSTCTQFKPRSTLFAVDDTAPAYRRLLLLPDGQIETELEWVDED